MTADSDPRIDPKLHPRLDFTVKAVSGLSGALVGGALELAIEVPVGGAAAVGLMSIGLLVGGVLGTSGTDTPSDFNWKAPVAGAAAGFFYGPFEGATLGSMAAKPIERTIWNLRYGSQYNSVFQKLDSIAE